MTFWNGSIIRKHRLFTGDISNHIEVKSITQLDDDEIDAVDEDLEDGVDLVQINEGTGVPYLVVVGWKPGGDKAYEYVVWSLNDINEENAVAAIADYIYEENARRREAGEEQITDEG